MPAPRYRYRLMELMEPTESLSVYNYTTNRSYTGIDWITNSLSMTANRPVHVVAENVIAMILLPKLAPNDQTNGLAAHSLATNYSYDSSINQNATLTYPTNAILNSHHQLPPVVQVTLVAVDEASAVRYSNYYAGISNTVGGYFNNASQFTNDLSLLQSNLASKQINFRVFTTDVMLKGAKWSGSQTN